MEAFFVNPAFVATGGALIASPIIIHIINRLRYRKIRFAAMEFLLQSQKKNRRRILIEQLLLLLLRILAVVGIVLLIARLKLSPAQVSILRGEAAAQHVILIDDSGSMREKIGATTGFARAKDIARRIVETGVNEPGEQRVSIYFLSQLLDHKEDAALENKEATSEFLRQFITALEGAECSYRRLDLNAGLRIAGERLQSDKYAQTAVKFLHVISDFRSEDWKTQTAITDTVNRLTKPKGDDAEQKRVQVNFIRVVKEGQPNLAFTTVQAHVETAAAGVPIPITLTVRNFSTRVAENIPVRIVQDGITLPRVILLDKIEPNGEVTRNSYVQFDRPGEHQLELRLSVSNDGLEMDNTHFLAIEYLPQVNRVLVVDGDPAHRDAEFLSDALSADPRLSGVQVDIQDPDWLIANRIQKYQCLFLLNVPQLDRRAIRRLEDYVHNGGGLAWFLGERVQAAKYNEQLYRLRRKEAAEEDSSAFEVAGLFPVPLAPLPREAVPPAHSTARDLRLDATHPVFDVLSQAHFADVSRVKKYWPVAEKIPAGAVAGEKTESDVPAAKKEELLWKRDDNVRKDGVKTLAWLSNTGRPTEEPFVFEHRLGRGTIFTCLTSAGRDWSNWPTLIHYPVLMMRIRDHIVQKGDDRQRLVGDEILERLPVSLYTRTAVVGSPEIGPGRFIPLNPAGETPSAGSSPGRADRPDKTKTGGTAKTDRPTSGKTGTAPEAGRESGETARFHVFRYTQTGRPGIYTLKFTRLQPSERTGSNIEVRMFACNVSPAESSVKVYPKEELRRDFTGNEFVKVFDFNESADYAGGEPGHEARQLLLFLMLGLLIGEQALAYRLSYHTRDA